MARLHDRGIRFGGPGGSILYMVIFLGAVGVVAYYLSPLSPNPNELLINSFYANPYLNGLILSVLALGVLYNFRQALIIEPSIRWIKAYHEAMDPVRMRLPRPPVLISTMARILLDASERKQDKLPQSSTTAILESIGTRIDEGRELGRYIGNLLVFLGLLGTFWGLLQTVTEVSEVISSLGTDDTGQSSAGAVSALINNLNQPLAGMSTAFSSSLFGLGGSLIVGFLDIQAGAAQNRFYTDLEDWLTSQTDTAGNIVGADGRSFAADDLGGALTRLQTAIEDLNYGQSEASKGVREEIRQLGRTLLEGDDAESGR